jgi:hypothetical protein
LNRSDFLKIAAATPFAFKALLMDHGKEHIETHSEDIETIKAINSPGLSIKKDNELIALSSDFTVSTIGNIDFERDPWIDHIQRRPDVEVHFESTGMPRKEFKKLMNAFKNDEVIDAEIYNPKTCEFTSFPARLTEIEQTCPQIRNQVKGSLLVLGPIDITIIST